MAIVEKECPLLLYQLDNDKTPKTEDLSSQLEKGDDEAKMAAIKEIIHCIIDGMEMGRLTMQVIKFCLRSKNPQMKKLLQVYWSVLDKTDASTGKLKAEMILVCNHLLQDLKNPNEYIRGSTCRLLCRIKESEILEQLIPQILANLEHRHSYVRKNAVLAVMSIYSQHADLIPDAPHTIFEFLMNEGNMLAKRNGFLMLVNCDLRNALDFFLQMQDKISSFPESMQVTVLELTRKVCRTLPIPKSLFVKCAANLLDANSNAVVYEAANTLLALTPLDTAVNRALEAYCRLLQSESDQNVKLIIINRLAKLKDKYQRNLRHVLMDILRALNTPNLDVKKQILSLVLDLGTNNNIEDIITCLKKEIILTNDAVANMALASEEGAGGAGGAAGAGKNSQHSDTVEYNNLLVETIHECAVKFPKVASSVVHLLINYLGEESGSFGKGGKGGAAHVATPTNHSTAYDVILFVREIVSEYGELRHSILLKLIDSFANIKSEQVYRVALWILGEYCDTAELIENIFDKNLIVPLTPAIVDSAASGEAGASAGSGLTADGKDKSGSSGSDGIVSSGNQDKYMTRTVVLDDGTYAQETITVASAGIDKGDDLVGDGSGGAGGDGADDANAVYTRGGVTRLNGLIKAGEYYLSTVMATTLLKLIMRLRDLHDARSKEAPEGVRVLNKCTVRALLTIVSVLKYADSVSFAHEEATRAGASENARSQLAVNVIQGSKKKELDNDSKDRLAFAIHCLLQKQLKTQDIDYPMCKDVFLTQCQASFGKLIAHKRGGPGALAAPASEEKKGDDDGDSKEDEMKETRWAPAKAKSKSPASKGRRVGMAKEERADRGEPAAKSTPFDKMISFGQLRPSGMEFGEFDPYEDDLTNIKKAVGKGSFGMNEDSLKSRLSRVHQLTGFSDPVYAEACVTVYQFDIILDILIINNTVDTLQNVCLELHTSGDLKLIEIKPNKFTLAKKSSMRIEASIKVNSTENGVIFGCIVFDTTKATIDENIVVMNCIHMDIMDYVYPAQCSIDKFRDMWVEFEWENKVPVNTDINDLKVYLGHVAKITNMQLLTDMSNVNNVKQTKCTFLAANLHAKSIFGEHALMNVSIELKNDNKVTGHIRIRCKSQGIALSLGEKITNKQRKLEK